MENFPSNSKSQPEETKAKEKIERVTTSTPVQRKKPLSKRFTETFIGGSPRNALDYMITNVLIPSARDMISEAVTQGFERLIYGGDRGGSAAGRRPMSNVPGQISYNRMYGSQSQARPQMSKRDRANHDFNGMLIASRPEAETVLERMFDILGQYQEVTVSDLYELVGLDSTHADHKWGWTDLRGSSVSRTRDGFLLNLPNPEPIS